MNVFEKWEESWNGFETRVRELYDAMIERGPEYVGPWMKFSEQMVSKLENSSMDEYDEWRIAQGKMPMFRSVRNRGKESLIVELKKQREVDLEAYRRYKDR